MKWRWIVTILFLLLLVSSCQPMPVPIRTPGPAPGPSSTSPPSAPQVEHRLQPPNSPSSLIGEPLSQSIVNLHWIDDSDNEDGFKIYRNGNFVASTGVNTANYRDTGLEAGRTYHYAVRAYNAAGESGASSSTVKMPNPPLNVVINYIGVKFDHDPMPIYPEGEIRLILFVSDGNQTVQEIIPPGEGAYLLNDYETIELKQRVFHTASAGEYLKVVIMAYEDDPETQLSDALKVALPVIASVFGVPILGDVGTVFSQYEEMTGKPLFENKDDYVGYFEGFWGSDESWGIGQHNAVGAGDFRVWLSIWSESQPPAVPKPTLLPDVIISNVDTPAEVEVGKVYTRTITLKNNESHPVTVVLNIHSSVKGDIDSKPVTVPAESTIDVIDRIGYKPAGVRTMTYTILYNGREFDSRSGTIEAEAQETFSVTFDGWYVDGTKVNAATKGKTVTGRITFSGGNPGSYNIRIRRDVRSAADQTVSELSFDYDGVSATKELSFSPPYATDEAGTDGYHVDVLKDGYTVWTLADAYPPRLRVGVAQTGETTTLRFEVLPRGGLSNRTGILGVVGRVTSGKKVSGEIFVTAGGNRDIAFSIQDPNGTTIYAYPGRIVGSANFSFVAQLSGSYTLLFDNSFSVVTKKSIELGLRGGTAWVAGATE